MTFSEQAWLKGSLLALGWAGAFVAVSFIGAWANAAASGVTGLSPYGPSPQAVSSASPFPSHFAGDRK